MTPAVARTVAIVASAALLAGGYFTARQVLGQPKQAEDTPQSNADVVTAPVEYGSLPDETRLNGTLTYGEAVALPPSAGMITALPQAGEQIDVGQRAYEVDGAPVTLMRGARPFWRQLIVDEAEGEDVKQLQENLAGFGFFEGDIDGRFDEWTQWAVAAWQESVGLEASGTFDPTMVAVVDAPAIRVSQVSGKLGESAVSPFSYTLPTREVQASLRPGQENQFVPGQRAEVLFADGTSLEAEVDEVRAAAAATSSDPEATPTLVVKLAQGDPAAGTSDGAVRVVIASAEPAPWTLLVPAGALLATDVDQFAVEVVRDGAVQAISVEIGRSANGKVQVLSSRAPGLAQGDQVVLSR